MIKPKSTLETIIPKEYADYNPATFEPCDLFIECDAQYVLDNFKPAEFDFLPGRRFLFFDTETYFTGIEARRMPKEVVRRYIKSNSKKDIPNDFPFCLSLCDGVHSYVIYDDIRNGYKELRKLEPLLADPAIENVAHNADFDMHMLANARVQLRGRIHDTMYMSKLARGNAFTHKLFDIAKECDALWGYDSETKTEYKKFNPVLVYERMLDAYKSLHKITDYRQFPHELMTQYTGADTWNDCEIFKYLYPMLIENNWVDLYDKECAVGKIAYWAERDGIPVDRDYETILIPELEKEVADAEAAVYETAGEMFNMNSGAQVARVLTKLGYGKHIRYNDPTPAMLAKGIMQGNPKLDKFEMERLSNLGIPLIDNIQKFKASQKLLNTFAIKIYEMADGDDLIHCNFNTMEAKTGRFSISSPSMQNMPRRKDARVRGAFTAKPGWTLYDFDFKSQEAIVLAHYSRAAYLLEMINAGHDIHKATASIVYGVPIDEVTKEQRGDAKSVGFAVTYGAGASKVAAMTGKTELEAKQIMARYMRNIPEVDMFIKTANKVMKERGSVRTIDNRYVYAERGREYACVNYIIQGSSAGSTKARMVDIYKFLKANGYQSRIVLQIHDSLNGMIKDEEAEELIPYWKYLQTDRYLFRVPVTCDVAICKPTWKDKKDIEIEEVKPPQEMLNKMNAYDIWQEGIF